MISAIVLLPDRHAPGDGNDLREIVVRSLVWLVSAVVAGVVRDVTLAGPTGLGLGELADAAGCLVIEADDEAERLGRAAACARNARVLILRVGYQAGSELTEEIDAFVRRAAGAATALILAMPETMVQRVVPGRGPVVGVLTGRDRAAAGGFGQLVRRAGRATRLRARATRIL